MCVLLVCVQVDSLGEALEANEAKIGLLPAMNQLMSLKLARCGKTFLTEFTRIFFLEFLFQHRQLEETGIISFELFGSGFLLSLYHFHEDSVSFREG